VAARLADEPQELEKMTHTASPSALRRLVPPGLVAASLLSAMPLRGSSALTDAPVPAQYADVQRIEESWSKERAALGKRLFHDRRLSGDRTVACSDCHRPDLAFTDGRRTAVGVRGQRGPRNTPTLLNRALGRLQFWDGRAASLEQQALGPIANPGEMDLPVDEAVARLQADPSYRRDFQLAFGSAPSAERLAAALAAYERTLYSVDAPFDRFLGGDAEALTPAAHRGLVLFGGKAKCSECHTGANFTDELFHCIGLPDHGGRGAVSGDSAEAGAFKTPTLREVSRTAPYMHDGSMNTLAEVVEYYDRGGDRHANLDPKMAALSLTAAEKADLVAFLESLSGTEVEAAPGRERE
jgi:cytochrome c peroxidase